MTTTDDTSGATQDEATETASTATETTDTASDTSGADSAQQQPQTFDAKYVSKLRAEAAKYRTEAQANADAAKKLAAIEDANKTEAQRLADAKSAAEADAASARAEALRWRIAAKHGVSDDEAELFLTGSDEATLVRQAEALAAMRPKPAVTPTTTTAPRPDLSQGARGGSTSSKPADQFAAFLQQQLNKS